MMSSSSVVSSVGLPIKPLSGVLMECAGLPADDVVGAAMARTAAIDHDR